MRHEIDGVWSRSAFPKNACASQLLSKVRSRIYSTVESALESGRLLDLLQLSLGDQIWSVNLLDRCPQEPSTCFEQGKLFKTVLDGPLAHLRSD